jgi:thiol-disulfide isomerase/thioredoxin
LYRAFDDAAVVYPDILADGVSALQSFVLAESLPPVVRFSYATQKQIFDSSIDLLVLLLEPPETLNLPPDSIDHHKSPLGSFHEAALSLRGDAIFVRVDAHKHEHTLGRFFQVERTAHPAIALYQKTRNTRFVVHGNASAATIIGEVRRVLEGTAKPLVLTAHNLLTHVAVHSSAMQSTPEERPASNAARDEVVELDGRTFDETVYALRSPQHLTSNDGGAFGNDVAVLFHAPWCIGCRDMEAKFDELAKRTSMPPTFRLAKLDMSDNRVASPMVRVLPSIYMLRADARSWSEAVALEGMVELAALATFFEQGQGRSQGVPGSVDVSFVSQSRVTARSA